LLWKKEDLVLLLTAKREFDWIFFCQIQRMKEKTTLNDTYLRTWTTFEIIYIDPLNQNKCFWTEMIIVMWLWEREREGEGGCCNFSYKKEIFHFFLANEFCDLLFTDKYFVFFILSPATKLCLSCLVLSCLVLSVSHLEIFVLAIFDAAAMDCTS